METGRIYVEMLLVVPIVKFHLSILSLCVCVCVSFFSVLVSSIYICVKFLQWNIALPCALWSKLCLPWSLHLYYFTNHSLSNPPTDIPSPPQTCQGLLQLKVFPFSLLFPLSELLCPQFVVSRTYARMERSFWIPHLKKSTPSSPTSSRHL